MGVLGVETRVLGETEGGDAAKQEGGIESKEALGGFRGQWGARLVREGAERMSRNSNEMDTPGARIEIGPLNIWDWGLRGL